MIKLFLHLEGLFVLLISVYFYSENQFSWLLFILLLFSPDLSMLGYLVNNRTGSICYNLFHTYILAIILIMVAVISSLEWILALGLILSAHIGLNRPLGYGLKYPSEFKDTHFNRV
ncbi:MAG TPA: DUF4260 domain-containing protein [Virgibacillus sp.]|nr:DUF4260 domain-containing protein [Virgibacillus sp.]HLR69101.1 DUF4260 domain-containing protein [Virgibacillus sp.]